jgi:acetyl esterase/lipase
VSAQGGNAIDPVWEEKIYKEIDGQSLRAFVFPAVGGQDAGAHPAIAFFHGGGWVFGRPQEFFGACERFPRLGFTKISFQYRLSVNGGWTSSATGSKWFHFRAASTTSA